jgi:ankyrin repeat protein
MSSGEDRARSWRGMRRSLRPELTSERRSSEVTAFRSFPASPVGHGRVQPPGQAQSSPSTVSRRSRTPSGPSSISSMNDTPLLIDVHSDEWPNDYDDEHEAHGGGSSMDDDQPRRFYYRDADGKLRARRLWRWYTHARHILGLIVPLLKRDSNSFLCAPMIENTLLNLTMLVIRILAVQVVLELTLRNQGGRADDCQFYTRNFLDLSSYTLVTVVVLCLPTLNLRGCRLHYQSRAERVKTLGASTSSFATTGDHEEVEVEVDADDKREKEEDDAKRRRMRKTLLFRICQLTVVLEVLYLLATIVMLFTDGSDENVYDLYDACFHVTKHYYKDNDDWEATSTSGSGSSYESVQEYLPPGRILVVVLVQVLAVISYVLRWRQIVLFHHLHLHFLFQTGIVPAQARLDDADRDGDEFSNGPSEKGRWAAMRQRLNQLKLRVSPSWWIRRKERYRLKMSIYRSAKRGRVEELHGFVRLAAALDGPRFADQWFTQPERRWLPLLVTCRNQHNPLHAAIVFDQPEVVHELIALRADDGKKYFDVNALDKMETHRITLSWFYHAIFSAISVVFRVAEFRSNWFGSQVMRPFGPSGVFHYTLISPLHVATTLGSPDMVRLLLQQGNADPNAVARSSSSQHSTPPLFWVRNNVECARLLLEADADPLCIPSLRRKGTRSTHGAFSLITAYEVARLSGNGSVARLMEAYGGDVALTPLHDASARGLAKEVAFYLSHGANPDVTGEQVAGLHGRTPLHWPDSSCAHAVALRCSSRRC